MSAVRELLSVIVPVWNNADTLAASLASITEQDYAALEIIVVDDGSTDGSAAIARQFGVVCIRQENAGPSAARNRGLLAASGKLISFLDADDRWPAGRVQHHLSILADAPATDMVIGTTRTIFLPAPSGEAAHPPLPAPLIQQNLGSITLRRTAFDKVGRLNPSLRVGEDKDWFKRALAAGLQIRMTPTVALEYYQRRGSLTFGTIDPARGFLAALHDSLQRRRRAAVTSPSATPPATEATPGDR